MNESKIESIITLDEFINLNLILNGSLDDIEIAKAVIKQKNYNSLSKKLLIKSVKNFSTRKELCSYFEIKEESLSAFFIAKEIKKYDSSLCYQDLISIYDYVIKNIIKTVIADSELSAKHLNVNFNF